MEWYRYDENTGEFLYPVQCQIDPLRPNQYLPIENATSEQPLQAAENQASIYKEGRWQLVDDYRGKTVYSKASQTELDIKELGAVPDTHTLLKPDEFDIWTGSQWETNLLVRQKTLCSRYCDVLDGYASTVRQRFISGNGDVIAEYQRAEQAALSFKVAGYNGDVPVAVQTHADAYTVTARDAADAILHMAGEMDSALDAIRDCRLKGKAELKALTETASDDEFKTVYQKWEDLLDQIKPQS